MGFRRGGLLAVEGGEVGGEVVRAAIASGKRGEGLSSRLHPCPGDRLVGEGYWESWFRGWGFTVAVSLAHASEEVRGAWC